MAIQYWQDLSIAVGSLEMAGHGKNCVLKTDVEKLDTTALNTTGWTTCIGGNKSGSVDLTFMSDVTVGTVPATAPDGILFSYLGTADVVKSFVTASAEGSTAYLMRGIPLAYTPLEGDVGSLAMGKISGKSSTGPVIRGRQLHAGSATRTSSSAGTEWELGALSATQTLYAALHVISVSGTNPTLAVKVQSDTTGFGSATDRLTFTTATDRSYEWKQATGAITDTFFRASWVIGGTDTPTFKFIVTCGIL
jgi:hypothetical protein